MNKISDADLELEYRKRFSVPEGEIISDSATAAKHFTAAIGDRMTERECFVVMLLNGRNQLVESSILFEGTLTCSVVYPREIIRLAIKENAAAVLVGHNHPSGNLMESSEDRKISDKIKIALNTVDIKFHDFLIVVPGGGGYTSFADKGLI
ncbi:MAG: DNA repair protein [Bacteroidetes bacterium]|jgi:DNA repair protein RadC|nr:DNA repair protein [Bacteroidota bacterium]